MLGAIIGDIVGSRFEWHNIKTKEFEFLPDSCFFTDDTVMTLALAKAMVMSKDDFSDLSDEAIFWMREIGVQYPGSGYGRHFHGWLLTENPKPYNSYGNGAAMRVSAAGIVGQSIEQVKELSHKITAVTHNHPEGIKGAEATAVAIFMAKTGKTIAEIRGYIEAHYYPLDSTLDEIRPVYTFDGSCQGTVPQALLAFFESTGFEDAIRNAISIGGDSDTLAAICGSVAGIYYGVPKEISLRTLTFLDSELIDILFEFERKFHQI